MWRDKRLETMLFNYETTGRTDFRGGEIEPIIRTKHKEQPTCFRIRPPPLKELQALTDWKTPAPFNLMHKPKETVQTNPWVVQRIFSKPEDDLLEHVQKTRPRLYMTPAMSLDELKDSDARRLLVGDVYTTTLDKMCQNTVIDEPSNVRAPLSPVLAPANPINNLLKMRQPYISPEWRMDSVTWDGRQLRSYCAPTRDFWLARTPKCDICDQTAEREAKTKIKKMKAQF